MSSEFQRHKISNVFHLMDTDHNGVLEESDFAALAERWASYREGTDRHLVQALMMGWWATLLAASDEDADPAKGEVSLEGTLRVVDRLGDMTSSVEGTAKAMFEIIDENGDDLISAEEYNRLIEVWNGFPIDTDTTFSLLDLNDDGYLTKEEFILLWTQFWVGDNPDEPGTWMFGRFEFPEARVG